MPENKHQHYVPQFHLRNFSVDGNNKDVSLVNIQSSKYIEKAPIRYQARKPYFYGKNSDLDSTLTKLENTCSKIIAKIIDSGKLPKPKSRERNELLKFILLLGNRTLGTVDQYNEMVDSTMRQTFREKETQKEFLENHVFQNKNAIHEIMDVVFGHVSKYQSLSLKILKNGTDWCFVSSDIPVVPYNVFLEKREQPDGGCIRFCRKSHILAKNLIYHESS